MGRQRLADRSTKLGDTHEQESSEEDGKEKDGGEKKGCARDDDARREDIAGIALDLPDISDWKQAARVLKIKPFYQGPGALPFSCFQVTQMHMDPPKKVGGVSYSSVNDFRLAEQCIQKAKLHSRCFRC